VSVADALPTGYTFVSATPALAYSSATGVWTIGSLANGATASLQVTAKVNATGNYLNVATVSGTESDPDPSNNTGSVSTVPVPQTDLEIAKAVDNATPKVGSQVVFTLTATNHGPSAATGVSVADALPTGYAFVSASPALAYNSATGVWTIGSLANGATASLQVTAKVNATGNYLNVATVSGTESDPDLSNNTGSVTTAPVPQTDLEIAKTVDNATPKVGSQVVFTLTATNHGPSAATGVSVADALPTGYTFVSATPALAYNSGTGVWTVGSLANGATASLQVTAKVNATGNYLNVATVTGTEQDPNLSNNTASMPTSPIAQTDLAITKTVNNPTPTVGSQVVFTLTATNHGPSDATGVSVSDSMPSGYQFISANPALAFNALSGVWTIGNLANGASVALQLTVKVNASGNYVNVAVISGNQQDPGPDNGTDTSPTVPIPLGYITGSVLADTTGNGTGDTGIPNVTLTLKDAAGNDIDSDPVTPGMQPTTTVTAANGSYGFANLPPGSYQVVETQPAGYLSVSDVDGGNLDIIGDVTPIVVTPGNTTANQTFVEVLAGSIGNLVWFDSNHNGHADAGEPGLPGITVELYHSTQIPGVDTPLATTQTNAIGIYNFPNLKPGNYVVYLPTAPDFPPGLCPQQDHSDDQIDNDNNGSQPVFGGPVTGPVINISPGENDMTIDFGFTCYGTWQEWQFLNPLGGKNQPGDNPDGDNYDNLIEYAFRLSANSGAGTPFILTPSTVPTSKVEFSFSRPVGATANVTYYLEYSAALGAATSWISIPLSTISSRNMVVTPVSACTESVTIRNFEAREGFVRLRVELDANGDHTIDHVSYTGIEGWTESALQVGNTTYNNPYPHCPVFTGTVDSGGVSGQTLGFTTSAGPVDLATLLTPGVAYYLEVVSGNNEGQRFDVVSATGSTVTLATDGNVFAATPPFNTLVGALPATLAGDHVEIRRHWTLGEMFPLSHCVASTLPTTADQVQTFDDPNWTTYWLFSNGGSPKWVKLGDPALADQAATVIAPGQGMFVNKYGSAAPILAYGEVRANKFIRPLHAGRNFVGGGYPITQTATGPGSRQMDLAHGFFGSTDPLTADSISIWQGDVTLGATGYDNYYLYNPGAAPKWVKTGDASLAPHDADPLFLGDRAVFLQMKNNVNGYTMANPAGLAPAVGQQFTSSTTWEQWQLTELAGEALNGPNDDPDHDGTPNLLEYVFGTSPLQAGAPTATPVEIVTLAGQRFLQITIPRRIDHPAALTVEVSSDLTTWDAGPMFTEVVSDTPAALVVRDLTPLGTGTPQRFMRLQAELSTP